ncbi:MAG: hypothetical protein MI748_02110 [Opitutales bacterium]|nr:hypothetical protein [Opitutales bacterium]
MNSGKLVSISSIISVISFVIMRFADHYQGDLDKLAYPVLYTISAVLLVSTLVFWAVTPIYLKKVGYNWFVGVVVSIMSVCSLFVAGPVALFVTPLVVFALSKSHGFPRLDLLGSVISTLIFGIFVSLDHYGFRIYGHSHFYRSKPPKNENWIRVVDFEDRTHIRLEDDRLLSTLPLGLKKEAFELTDDELSMRLFNVPLDDLYFRKEPKDQWITRVGNEIYCSHAHFFPERIYGYYEDEFPDSLMSSEVMNGYEHRIIEVVDEDAYRKYWNQRKSSQNKAVEEELLPAPRS